MMGLVEIITLLLGLTGFGLSPNPRPATADQALQYAMPDADIVVQFDAASVIPGNYKVLSQLPNQPQIKASPELSKAVREIVNEVEGARGIAKTATGIDLTTDISDATLFLQLVPNRPPNFVAAVRGKLSPAVIDKIAKMSNKQAQRVGTGTMIETGPNDPAIAVTKDNVLLAGTPALVRARLAATWKPPARPPGSSLGYAQDAINARPVIAVVMTLSQTARKEVSAKLAGSAQPAKKNFLTDLVGRHRAFAFSVFHDGIGWTWFDTTRPGLEQMAMMSEGMIELMRAFQIAPRGAAKMTLAAIDSYKGTDKRVDEIIRRKADIMKVVESYSGDGNFKVSFEKDPAKLRLAVRARGKSVSEVLPAGLVGPMVVLGLVVGRSKVDAKPPATIAVPPTRTAPPLPPGRGPGKPGTTPPPKRR